MKRQDKPRFSPSRSASLQYERSLRKIAVNIGKLIERIGDPEKILKDPSNIERILHDYANELTPWAVNIAENIIKNAEQINKKQWFAYADEIGIGLREELKNTDTSNAFDQILKEQVHYITSLPIDAAERIQRLAKESLIRGERYDQIKDDIMKSGLVTETRARLIARTEMNKASFALTKARAEQIGSPGYIWRSHKDKRTRPSHKSMNGKFVKWDDPPTLDNLTGHAGALPNCRCFTLVQF